MASDSDIGKIQQHPDYQSYLAEYKGDVALALQKFQSNHPTLYDKFSHVIYRDASDDPWWQARDQAATKRVNQGLSKKLDKIPRTERTTELRRIQNAELQQEAREFSSQFPDKAQEYRTGNDLIDHELSIRERQIELESTIAVGLESQTQASPAIQNPLRKSDTIQSGPTIIPPASSIPPASPLPDAPVIPPSGSTPIQVSDRRGILVIQTHTPQRLQTTETDAAFERTREHRSMVRDAGMFTLSQQEQAELAALHPQVNWEGFDTATATHLSILGVNPDELGRKVQSSNVLTRAEQNQLTNINEILKILQAADRELANDLREVNLYPQIVIERRDPIAAPLPDASGALALNPVGNNLQPLLNVATGEAKKRASSAITNKITGKLAKEGVKAGVKTATKAAASTTAAEVGATVGTFVGGPIGTLIVGAIGWLVGTVLGGAIEYLGKRANDLKDLAGGLIVGGGQAIGWIVGILWAATVGIGQAVIIAIISIPVIIAFIMFIINTSAWVVPPWEGSGGIPDDVDSAFIDVTKTPEPSSATSAPTSITYTITITAEQSSLTNASYGYTCTAIQANGNIACPTDPNVVEIAESACGTTIAAAGTCSFSYTVDYGIEFDDSLVTDTISVTADAEGLTGEVSTATANVIIGDPPTGCMYAAGGNWPADREAVLNQAIVTLTSTQPVYSSLVCAAGDIPICYGTTGGSWGYHYHDDDCDITMDSAGEGLANVTDALYILTHELGHHLDAINGTIFQQYLDSGATTELPLCSYVNTTIQGEGFAEGFALYVVLPTFWDQRCNGTFQSLYPLHYNYVFGVLN